MRVMGAHHHFHGFEEIVTEEIIHWILWLRPVARLTALPKHKPRGRLQVATPTVIIRRLGSRSACDDGTTPRSRFRAQRQHGVVMSTIGGDST